MSGLPPFTFLRLCVCFIYVCLYVCVYTVQSVCISVGPVAVCLCLCLSAGVCPCACACLYVYVCVCVRVPVPVCMWMSVSTDSDCLSGTPGAGPPASHLPQARERRRTKRAALPPPVRPRGRVDAIHILPPPLFLSFLALQYPYHLLFSLTACIFPASTRALPCPF